MSYKLKPTSHLRALYEFLLTGVATLTNKTLTNPTITSPTITSPNTTQGVSTHSYGTGHADWTLTSAEMASQILTCTGTADAGCAAIATPTAGKVYILSNATGQTVTIKASGQTGVGIANTKTAMVRGNGTDFVRVTADA